MSLLDIQFYTPNDEFVSPADSHQKMQRKPIVTFKTHGNVLGVVSEGVDEPDSGWVCFCISPGDLPIRTKHSLRRVHYCLLSYTLVKVRRHYTFETQDCTPFLLSFELKLFIRHQRHVIKAEEQAAYIWKNYKLDSVTKHSIQTHS